MVAEPHSMRMTKMKLARSLVALVPLIGGTVVLTAVPSQASGSSVAWVDQFGSRASERGTWGLDVFGSDVFTGGMTFGSLPAQTSLGDADAWIRRTDARGTAVWTTQFGTHAWDNVEDLDAVPDGVFVVGATRGSFGGPAAGGTDGYLAKFDRYGNQLWATQFGVRQDDWAISVVEGRSGIYVYGQTFGAFPGYENRGGADLFIAMFDPQGSLQWVHQFGSAGHEEPWAVEAARDGVYIDGYTDGRLGAAKRGSWDAYVGFISADGRVVWLRQFGSVDADFGSGLATDASGVYVSGQTYGTLPSATNHGGSDAFVRKFSLDGSPLWTRQFGTEKDDAAGAAVLAQHEVVVVGTTDGAFSGQMNLGAGDVSARSFGSADGATAWTLQFGTTGWDTVGWAWGGANRVFVVGDTSGAFAGETSAGNIDTYLARINVT
jgi:hypothetical protein